MAGAGVVHLSIMPEHMAHVTAHGLALLVFGALQIVWILAALRWWTRPVILMGVALSAGLILLWVLLYAIPSPFIGHLPLHARILDRALIVSKLLEGTAAAVLIPAYVMKTPSAVGMSRFLQAGAPIACVVTGVGALLWIVAATSETLFPVFSVSAGWPTWRLNQMRPALIAPAVRSSASLSGNSAAYDWDLPQGFPPPRVPEDNPMTHEKVELGRYLFYDKRLSGNGTQSCESCHVQTLAFSDGRRTPIGSTGEPLERNSQALVNVAYNATLTWANPGLTELERQILIPIFGEFPIELGVTSHEEEVLERFRQDERYPQMFATAFPDDPAPINFRNIVHALASFVRSLISGNSPYDRYVAGDKTALSESARRGMELFFSEELECHHCHTGFNFTLSTVHAQSTFSAAAFQNNGLYNLDSAGAYPRGNRGVYELTGKPEDMGRFRPPTLRNVALTAPYMHDGSIATLEEVIQHYMAGGRVIEEGPFAGDGRRNPYKSGLVSGFQLNEQEIADLIAFLESLTDESFVTDPRFSNPFEEKALDQIADR